MKTTDFDGKITKNWSFTPINCRLTLKNIFSTETFFTLIVSIVLLLEIKHGHERTDHRTSQRPIYQARHTVCIDG
jgi:hypothetical protein